MHSSDWNDLHFALAVAREGSLTKAAKQMAVSHTTVLRRIAALEKRLGVRLFDRLPAGYVPTAAGTELAQTAAAMAELATQFERRVAGRDVGLSGRLRITTTDTLMASVLPAELAAFHAAHPAITLEITLSNGIAALTHREADVAIRPASGEPEALFGRKVADLGFAAYVAPAVRARWRVEPGVTWSWIGLDDALRQTSAARWLSRVVPDAAPAVTADSLVAARDLAIAGLGAMLLPCYLGDASPGLVRLWPERPAELLNELWIVAHEDLRRVARVRTFISVIAERLARLRPMFEGAARR